MDSFRNGLARRWHVLLAAPFLLFLAGCVATTDSDGGTRFHYPLWLPLSILGGGLLAIPIGLLFLKSDKRLGLGLMTIVPLAAILMGGNYYFESAFVDDKGFEDRAGLTGWMKVKKASFDDTKSIHVGEGEVRGTRRSRRTVEVLNFEMKSGESETFMMSNDFKIEAGKRILEKAKSRGIKIIELPKAVE